MEGQGLNFLTVPRAGESVGVLIRLLTCAAKGEERDRFKGVIGQHQNHAVVICCNLPLMVN